MELCEDPLLAGTFAAHAASLSITGLGARSGAVGAGPVLEFMRRRGQAHMAGRLEELGILERQQKGL